MEKEMIKRIPKVVDGFSTKISLKTKIINSLFFLLNMQAR